MLEIEDLEKSFSNGVQTTRVLNGISLRLSALAGITLLVGGVVLMNILLVSVSERTGEIGLRRAPGATQRDIFSQFLAESLAITLLGMLSGSVLDRAASLPGASVR